MNDDAYAQVPRWLIGLFSKSEAPTRAFQTFTALLSFWNWTETGLVTPSVKTLIRAMEGGRSRRQILDDLSKLRLAGMISRRLRRGTSVYSFPWWPRGAEVRTPKEEEGVQSSAPQNPKMGCRPPHPKSKEETKKPTSKPRKNPKKGCGSPHSKSKDGVQPSVSKGCGGPHLRGAEVCTQKKQEKKGKKKKIRTQAGCRPPDESDRLEVTSQEETRLNSSTRTTSKQRPPADSQGWFEYLKKGTWSETRIFRPGNKARARMDQILSRKVSDPERKELVERLARAFARVYTRFRRRLHPSYALIDKEMKNAGKAAELTLVKGTTPEHVIAYWAEHVADFTRLKYPPLIFLSSPGNIDRAACESLKATATEKAKDGPRSEGHSFSDVSALDPRLRPGLEEAGFDTSDWPDRHLLPIQSAAEAKASGVDMFVSGAMLPLVNWAAKNLYERRNDEDRSRG